MTDEDREEIQKMIQKASEETMAETIREVARGIRLGVKQIGSDYACLKPPSVFWNVSLMIVATVIGILMVLAVMFQIALAAMGVHLKHHHPNTDPQVNSILEIVPTNANTAQMTETTLAHRAVDFKCSRISLTGSGNSRIADDNHLASSLTGIGLGSPTIGLRFPIPKTGPSGFNRGFSLLVIS